MLTPTRAPVEVTRPSATRRMRRPPARPVGWRRARRIAVAASALCLIPALVSYVHAIAQSSNSGLGIRTVEWLRDNGARGIVNDVENLYYSLTAPSKGGRARHALPNQPGTAAAAPGVPHRVHHYYRPPRPRPAIQPALPGRGFWHARFVPGGPRPPVL